MRVARWPAGWGHVPAVPAGQVGEALSAASAASLRIADMRTMIDEELSLRSSRDTRQALTVALVKPERGACWNHARNSSSAMLYTLFVIGEETLSSTIAFSFVHPAIFSTAIKSVIFGSFCSLLLSIIASLVMRTTPLVRRGHQARKRDRSFGQRDPEPTAADSWFSSELPTVPHASAATPHESVSPTICIGVSKALYGGSPAPPLRLIAENACERKLRFRAALPVPNPSVRTGLTAGTAGGVAK